MTTEDGTGRHDGQSRDPEATPNPLDAYRAAIEKYYYGMTIDEITDELNNARYSSITPMRINSLIRSFGGLKGKINLTDPINGIIKRPGNTVGKRIEEIRREEPEFADILTAAIELQRARFRPGNQHQGELFNALREPFLPENIGEFAWSESETTRIRGAANDIIYPLCNGDINNLIELLRPEVRIMIGSRTPTLSDFGWIRKAIGDLLRRLRRVNLEGNSGGLPGEREQAEALQGLDRKIKSLGTRIPRIVRETFVDRTIMNLAGG